jgi:hypothetical protein
MISFLAETHPVKIYSPIWHKYRPAIIHLMTAAIEAPQRYQFSSHEFKAMNPRERSGYCFSMKAFKGRSIDTTRTPFIGLELLTILESSRRAIELFEQHVYEFTLDRNFVLHVSKIG